MLYEQFKKVTFVAIFFGLIASGLHSNVDYSEELSEIDGPWEKVGAIFYDKYEFIDDESLDLSATIPVSHAVFPFATAAVGGVVGVFVGAVTGGITLFVNNDKISDTPDLKIIPATAAAGGAVIGTAVAGFVGTVVIAYLYDKKQKAITKENKINKKNRRREHYEKLLLRLINLWEKDSDSVPVEMHAFCRKLYDEYREDPKEALKGSFELVGQLRERVLQKSTFYHAKNLDAISEFLEETQKYFDSQKYSQPTTNYYSYPYQSATNFYSEPEEPKKKKPAFDLTAKYSGKLPYEIRSKHNLKAKHDLKPLCDSGLKRDVGTQCDLGSSYDSGRSKVYTGSPYRIKPSYNTGLTQKPRTTCDVGTQCN